MARRGGREHNAVEKRHAEAKWRAARERPHQAASDRAMQEQLVTDAYVVCWHDEGLAVHDETDVANKGFIQNTVNQFAVVATAIGLAAHFRSFRRSKVAHS